MMSCKTKQLNHQISGSPLLVESPLFGLFDDMGTGKSKTFIDAMCELAVLKKINAVLVICPNTVKSNWTDPDPEKGEIAKHGWECLDHNIYEVSASQKLFPVDKLGKCTLQWVVVNYDVVWRTKTEIWIRNFLNHFDAAIGLDEAHWIKNPGANRTRGCIRLGEHAKRRYIMSGTPVTKCPLDIYAQYRFLDWEILGYRNFTAYKNDIVVYDPFGYKVNGKPVDVKEYKNIDNILAKIAPFYRRVEKKDCLDLPPKVYTRREIPMNADQVKLYKEMKSKLVTEFEGQKITAAIALTKLLRLSQISAGFLRTKDEDGNPTITTLNSPKVKETIDIIKEHDGSVIVFFQEHPECQMLADALTAAKITHCELHGNIPINDRKEIIEGFKRGDYKVILCQQRTGGIGINLTAADVVIFFSNSDGWDYRAQAEDRAHRIGQYKSVTYIDMLSTIDGCQTIDHKILENVRKKESLAGLLIKNQSDMAAFLETL